MENLPTLAELRQLARERALLIEFREDYDLVNDSGWLPIHYEGELSGFEYYANLLDQEDQDEISEHVGSDGFVGNFQCTGISGMNMDNPLHLKELISKYMFFQLVLEKSGGVFIDPQSAEEVQFENDSGYLLDRISELQLRLTTNRKNFQRHRPLASSP
jgi:hypothetical protein